jgi:hypothetical protein
MPLKEIHDGANVKVSGMFASPAAASAARDEYYSAYPPAGYGTGLAIIQRNGLDGNALWEVNGSRSRSCD